VPGIVGMARALTLAGEELAAHDAHLRRLRDMALEEITARVPHVKLNGHRTQRLPGNLNLSFRFIEGESLLLMLDMKGIAASSGSACTSGSLDPADVRGLVDELVVIVERLRQMSPLYEDFVRSGGQA
jgi:cysteine desulfurase